MKRVQVTLTDSEGKSLIAKAATQHSKVRACLQDAKVLLVGGTTVSALSEELGYGPMRISGRIVASGTRTMGYQAPSAHSLLVSRGEAENVDDRITDAAASLTEEDLIVVGANAIDPQGRAALAFASHAGDERGVALHNAYMHGVSMVILCGLNKLIPSIGSALACSGRNQMSVSMGAAISLYNMYGPIIHEVQAFKILFDIEGVAVAGSGMLDGAGSRTYVLQGDEDRVDAAWKLCLSLKGAPLSGDPESLNMCFGGCPSCVRHVGCIYKGGYKGEKSE